LIPGHGQFSHQGHNLNTLEQYVKPNNKALGLVILEKILKHFPK